MWKITIFVALNSVIYANVTDKEIANMFIVGFNGNNPNVAKLCNSGVGGVILFKKSPIGQKYKNFYDAKSLKLVTKRLKNCIDRPLIAVDQEGGLVQRVKFSKKYPKASLVAKGGIDYAKRTYEQMASELHSLGVNLNFAPVADLAINPNNRVIVKFGRSYGSNAQDVISFNSTFINAMHKYSVATSLKHFPGHGSSLGDTHKGFVDVTSLWQKKELKPYIRLKNKTDTVMVAHIFNKNIDKKYPSSLSRKTISNLLRAQVGFRGVVVTDDMQMGAIKNHYGLKRSINLAINAGNDILLFANQLSPKGRVSINKLVQVTRRLINEGKIDPTLIKNANIRINILKNKYN